MTAINNVDSGASMSVPSAGQKRLVIVGATGMVGGYALRYALDDSAVGMRDFDWAQEARHLAPQAERGSASRLRGLLRTCGTRSRVRDAAVFCLGTYTGSVSGCGASHDNRGLHDRVRASSPRSAAPTRRSHS